jgi:hypothetical protein
VVALSTDNAARQQEWAILVTFRSRNWPAIWESGPVGSADDPSRLGLFESDEELEELLADLYASGRIASARASSSWTLTWRRCRCDELVAISWASCRPGRRCGGGLARSMTPGSPRVKVSWDHLGS